MDTIIGSARIDENGNLSGGKDGDQKQTSLTDFSGEVSMQKFYIHKKGWKIIRFKNPQFALNAAAAMTTACNNPNIGYDQAGRGGILKGGTTAMVPTDCDCSSLVRECFKEATGRDPGNFTTSTEAKVLEKTGLVDVFPYYDGDTLYTGDILVTKTKGHTVIVVRGEARGVNAVDYKVGKQYVLDANMSVRNSPTVQDKKTIVGSKPKGSVVVCLGVVSSEGRDWMQIDQHQYICARNGNKVYIIEKR